MEKIINQFFSEDVIDAEKAKLELIAYGEQSIDLVIKEFKKRRLSLQIKRLLGDYFGYFGNIALNKLILAFKDGDWDVMSMVAPCFCKLPYEPAGSQLIDIVFSGEIDKERLAIESIGYLGNPNWSFKLKDKLSENNGYDWSKLSYYLFKTYFQIATKAKTESDVRSAFYYIEKFYILAGEGEFKKLWDYNEYSMEIVFSNFKPIAADVIISTWLRHKSPLFIKLGLKAIGWMRLNRAVNIIKSIAIFELGSSEIIYQCSASLSMIDSFESTLALKEIYEANSESAEIQSKVALYLSMGLGKLSDMEYIENIYPHLITLDYETTAHTFYNLALLGFEESVWFSAINSEHFIVRASVAPAYARRRGRDAITKLLQMEREASHDIEKSLILTALIIAGHLQKKEEFLSTIYELHRSTCLRMVRLIWKREYMFALRIVEGEYFKIWEDMAGIEMILVLSEITELENRFKKPIVVHNQEIENHSKNLNERNAEVFISYSWGGESENVVDNIYRNLYNQKFKIIRDKVDLGYKGNIKNFMKSIGKGKYVVVVLSDKYLKSDNCMLELLEIKNHGDIYNRIFPVVLSDAKIYRESERLDYIIYWQKEIDELNAKIRQLTNIAGTIEVVEKLNQYNNIRMVVSGITELLRNMNCLSLNQHQIGDFSILANSIINAMTKDGIISNG